MSRGWTWEKAQTGNTHPGAVHPFGWVSACGFSGGYTSGYGRFGDSSCGPAPEKFKKLKLFGFTHFHHNGCGWIGTFLNYCLFTPYAGEADLKTASQVKDEKATPGYYAAALPDYSSAFELTTTRYAALHRYRFPKTGGCVRIDFAWAGYRVDLFGGRKGFTESVKRFTVTQAVENVWSGELETCRRPRYFALATDPAKAAYSTNGVLELAFAKPSAETAIAFSDESVAEAMSRVFAARKEGFDATRTAARESWEKTLSAIRAEFATPAEKRRFYSCLYQSFLKPVEYRPGRFAEFSTVWDMYRAQVPLVFAFAPVAKPLANSLLLTSEEYGYFPNCYLLSARPSHNDMQATALGVYVLAEACFGGHIPRGDYPRVKAFFEREFKTADTSKFSPTHIVDLAGAYRAAAFVAEANGDKAAAKEWTMAAGVWRKAYDPATGLLPKGKFYYEGDERNYSFRPHADMAARIDLAGGREKFERKLDDFFAVTADCSSWTPKTDRRKRPGHFEGINNESDMNTPMAWFWAGRADRVAEVHDLVRRCRFSDGEGGLPGNNDAGGISAWYVWSCLGISPLAGTPYVFLVSPSVKRASLAFAGGGRLEIEVMRSSARAIYAERIVFNGQRLAAPWLKIADLRKGGRLVFTLSEKPSVPSPVPDWL